MKLKKIQIFFEKKKFFEFFKFQKNIFSDFFNFEKVI